MHCMTAPSSILKLLVEGLEKCILALDVDFDFRSLLLELVGFRYPFVFLFCDFPHDTETSYYFPSWIPRCVLTHWLGYILNFSQYKKHWELKNWDRILLQLSSERFSLNDIFHDFLVIWSQCVFGFCGGKAGTSVKCHQKKRLVVTGMVQHTDLDFSEVLRVL